MDLALIPQPEPARQNLPVLCPAETYNEQAAPGRAPVRWR